MAPTGVIGSIKQLGHADRLFNEIIDSNEEAVYQTDNPRRTIRIRDKGVQTEIDDIRERSGKIQILGNGQSTKVKPGLFDEEQIRLTITHYNNKES